MVLYFITGNNSKFAEAKDIIKDIEMDSDSSLLLGTTEGLIRYKSKTKKKYRENTVLSNSISKIIQ